MKGFVIIMCMKLQATTTAHAAVRRCAAMHSTHTHGRIKGQVQHSHHRSDHHTSNSSFLVTCKGATCNQHYQQYMPTCIWPELA